MRGHEIFVGTDAVAAGALTQRDLRRRCDRIYRNVYTSRGHPLTARDRAMAAWLWSGRKGVLAGNSAAALFGAKWIDHEMPAELITSRTRPPPLLITRNEVLSPDEFTIVNGIPVTTPERTAFDLGRRDTRLVAIRRLDALARATGVTAAGVAPLVHTHRGGRGMKQLRELLPLMDAGAESPQETATRLVLVDGGLPPPRTQIVVIDEWGLIVARIDMGWRNWLVGVEFDGSQHWTDPRQRARDIDRAAELDRLGWQIVRVSHDLLANRPGVVVERVRGALRARGAVS
jgi:hypothetical protein